ncbi:MAG: TonB-dependent receptor, partial [Sphingobacteriales bacterium]
MPIRSWLTVCFLLLLSASFAQTARLSGKVANDRGEPVAGASIKILGTAIGTTTNVEGVYFLNLSTGNKYTLEISAVGYTPKSIADVDVTTTGANELNVLLETASKVSDAIVVRATSTRRQESTTSLIAFQKNNTALSSGLAADFIRRTPDRNTGEVLKRVSGASIQDNKYVVVRGLSDRYNQAMINGAQLPSSEPDKKVFSFDLVPAQMVDNIVINKTATPDLPGEFAGGLVQIRTKDVPTRKQLSVGFSVGYNTQSTFKDFTSNPRNGSDWLGFDNGSRNLPAAIPSTTAYRALPDAEKIRLTKDFPGDVYTEKTVKA